MGALVSIKLPDIGDFEDVEVIEVMVKPGDKVRVDDSLITIESDKASMEVPATETGIVKELKVKVGDRVSEGSPILVVETTDESAETAKPAEAAQPAPRANSGAGSIGRKRQALRRSSRACHPRVASGAARRERPEARRICQRNPASTLAAEAQRSGRKPHASPAVRKFARELGVDLARVKGTGLNGRIFRSDVQAFVKNAMAQEKRAGASGRRSSWRRGRSWTSRASAKSNGSRFRESGGSPRSTSRATG